MTNDKGTLALQQALAEIRDEGVDNEREQLLLWIIRNQHGVSPEDSYASILAEREIYPGVKVDAALVTIRRDLVSPVYVLYGESVNDLKGRVQELAVALRSEDLPEARLVKTNAQLRSLFEPVTDRRLAWEVERIIMCICLDNMTGTQRASIVNAADESVDVDVIDGSFIAALADAEMNPTSPKPPVSVTADPSTILDLRMQSTRAVITPVPAEQIAKWPGITDRTLFDLNVRYALGLNRVRRSLDAALKDPTAADEFIAYHNGITAVCADFELTDSGIDINSLSVVNGAQTVVAIYANAANLAPGLRVLLKLVQAAPETELARNIAIRSNTQNPVTSRNLRALDEVQARLQEDLKKFGYVYLRRPNDKVPAGDRVIHNDNVAQLLCSIYARKPALAVKRQVLFELPQYREIFPADLDPARVVFAHILRRSVEMLKGEVPQPYGKAWALTALTLVYMVAEAMRDDPKAEDVLLSPGAIIGDPLKLEDLIAPFAQAACAVLHARMNTYAEKGLPDDFKVAFKQTRTLSELAMEASKEHRRMIRNGL